MKTGRQLLRGKGEAVHSIAPQSTVYDALKLMAERNVGALVVVEGGRLAGIMSERDYARKVVLLGRFSKEIPVADIMTREVVFVRPSDSVETCMALMTQKRIRHLPVLEEGVLVGVISIGDVVKSIIDDQQFTIQQLEQYLMGSR